MRLNQLARKLDVTTNVIVSFLQEKGLEVKNSPNTKLLPAQIALLQVEFGSVASVKEESKAAATTSTPPAPVLPVAEEPKAPKENKNEVPVEKFILPETKIISKGKISFKKPAAPILPTLEKQTEIANKPVVPTILQKAKVPMVIPTLTINRAKGSVKVYKKNIKDTNKTPALRKRIPRIGAVESQESTKYPKKGRSLQPSVSKPGYKKNTKALSFTRKKRQKRVRNIPEEGASQDVKIAEFSTTQELALLLHLPVKEVIKACKELDIEVSSHQRLPANVISLVAELLEQKIELVPFHEEETAESGVAPKQQVVKPRDPVVVVMGHVDHGKTTFLDYIRKTKVAAGESGGITQHIGAYQVITKSEKKITFLDTPGHKAFTAMRARGAQVTDIAIIVIAADDRVMPQTQEAIRHAQLAGIPIVFALTKIDLPHANVDKIKGDLGALHIKLEEWGGIYQCQAISAKTGDGVEELLEKVLLEAEMLELKADVAGFATGTVLETSLEKGRGYMTTVIVQGGTLRQGQIIVAGAYFGKIKALVSSQGTPLKEALPSTPVQVLGFNGPPQAGQLFHVVALEKEARAKSEKYQEIIKEQKIRAEQGNILQRFEKSLTSTTEDTIAVLIKGDVDGSVNVLADELLALSTEEVSVKIVHKAVGPVCESDILLAEPSKCLIIGFHTFMDNQARKANEMAKLDVQFFTVIYEAIDYVQEMILNKHKVVVEKEHWLGEADVVKLFNIPKVGTIAGCIVKKGVIRRNAQIHIMRKEKAVYTGPVRQLKREKEVIKEAIAGTECGISLKSFDEVLVGDRIVCFEMELQG